MTLPWRLLLILHMHIIVFKLTLMASTKAVRAYWGQYRGGTGRPCTGVLRRCNSMIQSAFAHLNDHSSTLSLHDVKARLLWTLSSSQVSIKRPTEGKRRHLPTIRTLSTENSMEQKPDQRILEVASWAPCLALTLSNLPGTISTILWCSPLSAAATTSNFTIVWILANDTYKFKYDYYHILICRLATMIIIAINVYWSV